MPGPTSRLHNPCPTCGRPNDTITAANPATRQNPTPTVGAGTLCWGCRTWAVVDQALPGALYLRKPTPAELDEINADPDVQRVLFAAATHQTPLDTARTSRT